MMDAPAAWDELRELGALLDEFGETAPGEYVGVDLMRASLEQRRANLIDGILSQQESVQEQLDIVLTGEQATGRGVRVSVLVELLQEIQEALAAIGTAIARGPRRVRVSAQMRDLVAMRVSLALPGSLAVRLVPAERGLTETEIDLFGEHASVLEQSADRLVSFFQSASEAAMTPLDAVSEMGPRGTDRLQRLAAIVAKSGVSARLRWQSPRIVRQAFLDVDSATRIQGFLSTLEESEHTVVYEGRLLGGSLLRRRFELVLPDEQVITGSVEESVLSLLPRYFGGDCRAAVVVSVLATPGGLTKQSRTLVSLTAP